MIGRMEANVEEIKQKWGQERKVFEGNNGADRLANRGRTMKKDGSWVGGARFQVVDQEGINVGGRSSVMRKMGEKWQKGWRKQAEDKFSKGNIEEAMDLTNPEEEEFEMRVRNGTLPTKAVMYHIRKNKTEDKRAGYRDTMCPRCGQSKEDQFHVFVKCPWNVQRIGKLKSDVRECMKAMIWSELVARTEIENMEWFGCEKEKKEGTGIDVRRWNAEVEMGYKGITFKDIKKCITEFCREVWNERNEIWVEERWRQRREGKETIERSESDVVGKLESQIEDGQVNEEGYKENKNEQVEEKTDQEEGQ